MAHSIICEITMTFDHQNRNSSSSSGYLLVCQIQRHIPSRRFWANGQPENMMLRVEIEPSLHTDEKETLLYVDLYFRVSLCNLLDGGNYCGVIH